MRRRVERLLLTAHRELEALCLDRDLSHFKQHIGLKYAEIVYFGLWFTPLRESLQAFVESTQHDVNGTVTLALYKGNIDVAGRKSDTRFIGPILPASPWAPSYEQKDAEGFIRILGLPARSRALVHAETSEMKMWSGRFSQAQNADFEQWQRSFPFDRILLPYEVAASRAHAAALATAGVLDDARACRHTVRSRSDRGEGMPDDDGPSRRCAPFRREAAGGSGW